MTVATKFQYIELTKEFNFRDAIGRYTNLIKKAPGVLLDEDNLEQLEHLSDRQRRDCFELMKEAKSHECVALIGGYPCILQKGDFIVINPPKIMHVPIRVI